MSFFVFPYDLHFKVYFVWVECAETYWVWVLQLLFLVFSIGMSYLFPSPHIQCICVLCDKVSFCIQQIEGFCFFIKSSTLCLLIGAFSSLTFKVIIDRYVFIAILNLVFHFIICFSFLFFVGCFHFILCLSTFERTIL